MTHNPEDVATQDICADPAGAGRGGNVASERTPDRLPGARGYSPWWRWADAYLLLFHHHGGMHGPDAMKTMVSVQHQHLHFAEAGAGAAVAKGSGGIQRELVRHL